MASLPLAALSLLFALSFLSPTVYGQSSSFVITPNEHIKYAPAVPANWAGSAPSELGQALDALAVGTLPALTAQNTLNIPHGASLPATCAVGDTFLLTTTGLTNRCTATNTWTASATGTVTSVTISDANSNLQSTQNPLTSSGTLSFATNPTFGATTVQSGLTCYGSNSNGVYSGISATFATNASDAHYLFAGVQQGLYPYLGSLGGQGLRLMNNGTISLLLSPSSGSQDYVQLTPGNGTVSLGAAGLSASISFVLASVGGQGLVLQANGATAFVAGGSATHGSNAVNYWSAFGRGTTGAPWLQAGGADSVVTGVVSCKGNGCNLQFQKDNGDRVLVMTVVNNAANYLGMSSATTGNAASISTLGSDADIDLKLILRGQGVVWYSQTVATCTTCTFTPYGSLKFKDGSGTARYLVVTNTPIAAPGPGDDPEDFVVLQRRDLKGMMDRLARVERLLDLSSAW